MTLISSSLMASITTLLMILFSLSPQLSLSQIPSSTISAAPSLLPTLSPSPSPSPSSSPDIFPLFPSQGPSYKGLSPTESTLPIIPSSPSPPNPDDMVAAEGPTMAMSPFDSSSLPDSSSKSFTPFIVALVLVPFLWFLQLSGM